MDALDRRIVRVLQQDADLSSDQIGERVHLSASAVQRRVAKLKRDGVIERIVAVANPQAAGLPLTIIVEVKVQHEQREALERFQRWLAASEEVQSCWQVTGSSDYMLTVAVADLNAYQRFVEALMTDQSAMVRRYESHVVLKTIKSSLALGL